MKYLVTAAVAACLALATSGCSEVAAQTPQPAPKAAAPSSLQSFDAAISPISVKLDALQAAANATQTNTEATNATLDKLTSQASDIGATATNIDDNVSTALDKLDELLRRDSIAPKAEPTPAPTPAPIDAPPVEQSDQRMATITVDGQEMPLQAFIDQWYIRPWRCAIGVDQCLTASGVGGDVMQLDQKTKELLHAAIHERRLAMMQQRAVTQQPVQQPMQNCPGGVCPTPQMQAVQRYSQVVTPRRSKRRG